MEPYALALSIALPIAALMIAAAAFAYFYALPKFLIKKIRSGDENLKYPENFDEIAAKIQIERDLKYASKFPNAEYDLYRPKNGEIKGLVLWVHGGFFIAGDKKGVENVCAAIAADGFAVAALNYAVAPEHKYPTQLIQLKEAAEQLCERCAEYAEKGIFVAGDSAGGQIAAQYAALVTDDALKKEMNLKPKLEKEDLKGVVLVSAPIDIAELREAQKIIKRLLPIFGRAFFGKGKWYRHDKYNSAKLYDFIGKDFPPAFVTDGNHVTFEHQNKKLAALLTDHGVYNETLFFDRETEGVVEHEYLFDLKTEQAKTGLRRVIEFLNRPNR